ncbi:MAG: hypothetical protein IJK52_03020 [Oscillospiraceae bacterium]|nr:hypothetical protein [Oscillospiraceae bacterium]
MDFLTGLLIELAGLAGIGVGFVLGWKVRGAVFRAREPSVESPDEEEARRMEAEQAAFKKMMDYSVETAYGLNRAERIDA